MVLRYTWLVKFEDCLEHHREALICSSSIKREYWTIFLPFVLTYYIFRIVKPTKKYQN
jgi:hypothetical protein